MIETSKLEDEGIAAVLIERFEKWILPRALEIKARVDQGAKLDKLDIDFLEEELKVAQRVKFRVDREPEFQSLYMRVLSLYEEIVKKGLENEQAGNGSGATS
jgi:hypothetical protein